MAKYPCKICGECFLRPSGLEKHLTTKKHQRKKKEYDEKGDNTLNYIHRLENKMIEMESEIMTLRRMIFSITTSKQSNVNVAKSGGIIINNNINITLRQYEESNWKYLDEEIISIMNSVNTCIPKIVEKLHFDPNHPENHNIKIPNKKDNRIEVFDGKDWETRDKNDTIDKMGMNIIDKLEDEYEEEWKNQIKLSNKLNRLKVWKEKKDILRNDDIKDEKKKLRKKIENTILDGQKKIKQIK